MHVTLSYLYGPFVHQYLGCRIRGMSHFPAWLVCLCSLKRELEARYTRPACPQATRAHKDQTSETCPPARAGLNQSCSTPALPRCFLQINSPVLHTAFFPLRSTPNPSFNIQGKPIEVRGVPLDRLSVSPCSNSQDSSC